LSSGKISYKFLIFLGLSLIISNCSVERNTGTTRFYQGLTAHYNIYFNGYENFKAGVAKVNKGYKDDYSELLRVFPSSDPSTVSLCSSDMERAIQKASKLISLKSITAKPEFKAKRDLTPTEKTLLEQKEYNKWVDDSYYLIGMARFYKHEFNDATAVFNYCINEANDPVIKIESSIWLARISNETGNFTASKKTLSETEIKPADTKTIKALYYTTLADMYLKQKMYAESINPLTKSLDYLSGKSAKYRTKYLLAQLYERSGDSQKATSLYREVVNMNPPYDVEFNARINIAGVFDVNSGKPAEIARELEKMLKDSKNKEYLDQIYFALGNMMMKEGKEKEAIGYYRKSASSASENMNQKGKSYLALANYYYSKPDYLNAGKYFDSTVYFIDQKYPDYRELKAKSLNLNALTTQLMIIEREDSLQKVAAMPESKRDALIAGIIAKITNDESQGKTSDYAGRAAVGQFYENERRSQNTIDQEGKWYFYNQAALTFGRTEFRRRWGDRRLEDNWRRSNKATVNVQQASAGQEEGGRAGSDTSKAVKDYKKPEFYLKNLPLTDSLISISNGRIADAYFEAGKVFSEKISDRQKAAESYETLLTRFPASDLIPEALYSLYRITRDNNDQKAETYRQRLLEKYPGSEFSRILSDPDYYNKKIASMKLAESLYDDAYNAYNGEHFDEAIRLCNDALSKIPKDDLAPKFMLLRAYSTAKISDERTFKEELNTLIKAWPETAESKKAAELIAYLNQKLPELKIEEDRQIAADLYTVDTTAIHVFVIIIMDPAFNINQATFDVISYNIDNFTNKNYRTESMPVNNKYVMITVSGFASNKQAWEYYDAFSADKQIRNSSGKTIMTFLINNTNLQTLDKDKNPERYSIFFKEKYLTGRKNK
jgi:tetratricopeptide (TPR) repeat protein